MIREQLPHRFFIWFDTIPPCNALGSQRPEQYRILCATHTHPQTREPAPAHTLRMWHEFYRCITFAHITHCPWPFVKISHLNCFLYRRSTSSYCTNASDRASGWVRGVGACVCCVVRFLCRLLSSTTFADKNEPTYSKLCILFVMKCVYHAFRFQFEPYACSCVYVCVSVPGLCAVHVFNKTAR